MKNAAFILAVFIMVGVSTGCRNAETKAKPETAALPSAETLNFTPPPRDDKKSGLVEPVKLDNAIKLDIRYATPNNFVGRAIYREARAFLQKPAAAALVRIHRRLKKENLGLVIFDGYRPLSATKIFWEVTPAAKKKYVANPKNGSRHNRGCAVDLSLYNLKTGENVEMPTDFDDFTERAAPDYAGATKSQQKNREILRRAMESDGFQVYAAEWWHYDFQECPETQILDIPFAEIK
jgi:zinc D-Ala-D-Ala dipeptidase